MRNNRIIVFDTETDSLNANNANLLEIGFQVINIDGNPIGELMSTFVYSDKPIPKDVTDINNITNKDLEGAPLPEKVIKVMEKHCEYYKVGAIAAHNISYDINVLAKYVKPGSILRELEVIDTLRLARRLFLNLESYKLGDLADYLDLEPEKYTGTFHSAGFDTAVTVELIKNIMNSLCEISTLEELIQYHDTPVPFIKMPFGKYRGVPMNAIPKDYINWLKTINIDIDLKRTLEILEAR